GVVIGKTARSLESVEEALEYVAGYVVSNDVSERALQFRTAQWDKGKSCENFNPLGPALVPASKVPDPQAVDVGLRQLPGGERGGRTRDPVRGEEAAVDVGGQPAQLVGRAVVGTHERTLTSRLPEAHKLHGYFPSPTRPDIRCISQSVPSI
ncbi:MAG TPA: fumarylacetoacetate hydrolase family protein, partial [Streptomyces sp.]